MVVGRVGALIDVSGRTRTIGLVASRGRIRVAITAGELDKLVREAGTEDPISSAELLTSVTVDGEPCVPQHDRVIGDLCILDSLLGEDVVRYDSGCGRIHGVVTALRGSVQFCIGDDKLIVRQLVEVTFDGVDPESGQPLPELQAHDGGSLVTIWNGDVVGLLVGRLGSVGYVAPVTSYLKASGLVHDQYLPTGDYRAEAHGRLALEQSAGLEALTAELAREDSLGLAEIPEAA